MTADIHTMTGAYALDALDDHERAMFEQHLAVCDACKREVDEFQSTAAHLGSAAHEAAPAGLKASVMAEIDRTRQASPLRPERVEVQPDAASLPDNVVPLRRPWFEKVIAPAAAVLAIAVAGLSVTVSNLSTRLAEVESASAGITQVASSSDVVTFAFDGSAGQAQLIWSPTRGEGYIVASDMGPAPDGHVYEAWLITADGRAIPAGLFDAATNGTATHHMTGDMGEVVAIGIRVEPEGGSEQPTSDPVMVTQVA